MELKLAKKQDMEQIYNIVQETIKTVYPKYYLKEIVDMFCEFHNKENILNDIESKNTYILLENNQIIGTGTKKENHITRVYVLPEFQNKGYGTFIMNSLEDIIKQNYTYADIDASLPACILYSHLGYKTIDHGIWECKNGVIQIYEIMKKEFLNNQTGELKLRPYKTDDAKKIVGWIKDEYALRKWSSDRYGAYPVTADDINYKYMECNGNCEETDNFYPMTAVTLEGVVGHLILRYTDKEQSIFRIGFVIVDDSKRGMGYGKKMMQMAISYAFDMLKAKKVTIGVFENNSEAFYCYKAAGFQEVEMEEELIFEILGERWKCIELEINR